MSDDTAALETDPERLRAAIHELPFPIAAGPGLSLRPLRLDDAPKVATWRGSPEVARYLGRPALTPSETAEFVRERLAVPTALHLIIERADTPIGEVGGSLSPAPHLADPTGWWEMSLFYTLHPDAAGAGVATMAATALCDHVFHRLPVRRITATCFADHAASARVLEKTGLRLEARFRSVCMSREGEWWDDLVFAVLRDEWRGTA